MATKIKKLLLVFVIVGLATICLHQESSAAVVNVTASCGHTVFTPGMTCDVFNDITVDTNLVSKIEITSNGFDDYGRVEITSFTGVVTTTVTSNNGCLILSAGTIPNGDITSLFTSGPGVYTIRVTATDDAGCGVNMGGWVNFELTYAPCLGPSSPACDTPGPCQALPGECVDVDGVEKCKYAVSAEDCSADGDPCTLDHCSTLDGGITGVCVAGTNVCGGLIPCGRMADDPTTTGYREDDDCILCHLILMVQLIIDFLVKIAAVIAAFFLAIAGFMYILSSGKPELLSLAKTIFKTTLMGFALIFIAWIMVETILTMFGFIDPLGDGNWHVMC